MIQKFDAKTAGANPQIKLWERNLNKYSRQNRLNFIKRAFYLAKSDNPTPSPEDTGLVLVRIALSDLEGRLSSEIKYVILQTYYHEGDLSTIDVVRLPLDYHMDIVKEYLEKILTSDISGQVIPFNSGYTRFLTAGGHVKFDGETIKFYDSSISFSNWFSIYDVNEVSSYLVSESELFKNVQPQSEKGKEYVEICLDIMRQHKLKPEFYSQLIDLYVLENIRKGREIMPNILYSLHLMKSIDRAIKEGKDIYQVLVEEHVEGIGREIIVSIVGRILEERLKKQE